MNRQNFASDYNARKAALVAEQQRLAEQQKAKQAERKAFEARKAEIGRLVASVFVDIPRSQETVYIVRRKPWTMETVYETAESLASIGGEDFENALAVLKHGRTSLAAYRDACDAMLIGLDDSPKDSPKD